MSLPKLHFITQPNPNYSNSELVEKVCLSGVRLIQLRIKDQSLDYIFEEAKAIKSICKKYQATFILNDHVSIVKDLSLDGVHLGKSDIPPTEARSILGENTIIGGTANDFSDIKRLIDSHVDYIGLGPYSFTDTKKNLSPILGIEGYKNIFNELQKINNTPPIYAIGGIQQKDITPIINTGAYGIAVSGLITNSKNLSKEINSIQILLDEKK